MISAIWMMLLAAAPAPACRLIPALDEALRDIEAKRLAVAGRLLSSIPADSANCPAVLAARGRLELAQRNYATADALAGQALRADPDDPGGLALRGQLLVMQGRVAEARAMLHRSVKLQPANAEAVFQLGAVYDRAKLASEAVQAFESAIRLRPRDARAHDYLALNLERLGETERALAAYQKGLAVNAEPWFDYFLDYNYGRLLLKLNRLAESKTHLDRALQLVPNLRVTHYDHAKLNLRLGRLQEARHDAEQALRIPDQGGLILDLQVYNLLVQIYSLLGENELAEKYSRMSESTAVPLRANDRR